VAKKKESPLTRTSSRSPPPPTSQRSVVVPTAEDIEMAREDALLQLRIGRSAHYYSVVASAALVVDGFLVLFLQPTLNAIAPAVLANVFFLIFPLLGGLYLSIFGLRVKWEVYQLWPWELHFWLTLGSVGLNLVNAYLYFASLFSYGATGSWHLLPWFYPLALLGISAPMASLALTWPGWGPRKVISLVAALLPLPLAFVLYIPSTSAGAQVNGLAVTLFAGAFLYQTAGSFLHLISSGTRIHEREVITSGQSRLFQLAEEVSRKEEALLFREQTLIRREVDAEDSEASILAQRQSLEDSRGQVASIDAELKARAEALARDQQATALQAAETRALGRTLEEKQTALGLRESEVTAQLARVTEREQGFTTRESELTRREIQVAQREQESERRVQGVPELETRLDRRKEELERRTAEVIARESALTSRESMATASGDEKAALAGRLHDLEGRETRLNQLKLVLDEQNALLGRRAKQAEESLTSAKEQVAAAARRQETLTAREATLNHREAEAKEHRESADRRQGQYEEMVRRYEDRLKEAETRAAEVATRDAEITRLGASLKQREEQIQHKQDAVETTKQALDRAQRAFLEHQKSLEAREAEVSLRRQELSRWSEGPGAAANGPASSDQARAIDFRLRELEAKEAELNRREYELSRTPTTADTTLAPPPARRVADRLPTGTPRLDDLLLGGIPPKGHMMLVGAPFIGKEIALYSFVAEGLKRGEPVVLVTAARSPVELAQEIGLVTPQFRQYEQMGRVFWVDASNPSASPGPSPDGNRVSVKGPGDHAGILSALVQACKKAEKGGSKVFRVGFLGLSASLAQGEQGTSLVFLQNLVGILKARPAQALYAVDGGSLSDAQLETIQGRMDGAIRFKQDHGKTFLSVQGLGEAATREWVEYRATNRALLIGSFSLERIR
jgi:KaiC/GvpD/RAD55 family RecA-like ATPase